MKSISYPPEGGTIEMNKNRLLFLVILLYVFVVVGCGNKENGNKMDWVTENTNSRKEMANKYAEKISESIEKEDIASLIELFSDKAINEIGSEMLEKETEELVMFFQGKNYSYEGNVSSYETNNHGVKTLRIDAIYKITTDKSEYRIYFVFQPINDKDMAQLGLSHIISTTEENYQKDDFKWLYLDETAGVFIIK